MNLWNLQEQAVLLTRLRRIKGTQDFISTCVERDPVLIVLGDYLSCDRIPYRPLWLQAIFAVIRLSQYTFVQQPCSLSEPATRRVMERIFFFTNYSKKEMEIAPFY